MSDAPQYPWQQFVLDAFNAPPESLRAMIEVARQAIAGRLRAHAQPDAAEAVVMSDALNALRVLTPEPEATPEAALRRRKWKKDVA